MRSIAIDAFGGLDKLVARDLPRPRPDKSEVLIRVVAAGVNPVDWKIREGALSDMLPHGFPLIPGWDVAGVVEEFGDGASRFRKGDRVWAYARKPTVQWGCYAEYVAVPEAGVALMPAKLLFEEAAAVPLAALTAYQALFGKPGVGPEASVLVLAAGGGVGHFAVQLARNAGAKVFGTCGPDNLAFVLSLGATAAIDYKSEDFVEVVRRHCPDGVDLVLDTLGGGHVERGLSILKPGGRLVGIVDEPDTEAARRQDRNAEFLFVEPSSEQLAKVARAVDQQRLRPHVQKIYRLDQAAEAQQVSQEGHVRGKLVLNL